MIRRLKSEYLDVSKVVFFYRVVVFYLKGKLKNNKSLSFSKEWRVFGLI